jgi:hypothetical protein
LFPSCGGWNPQPIKFRPFEPPSCAEVAGTVRNGQPGHALLVPAGSIRYQQLPRWSHELPGGFTVAPLDFRCMMAEIVGFDSKGGAAAPAKPAKQEPFAIGCCVCPSGSDRAPATCRSGPGDPSTRSADIRCPRRLAEGRNRKVVADRQSGESQSGVNCRPADLRLWHIRDIARSQIDFRFRRKSGHAADIAP